MGIVKSIAKSNLYSSLNRQREIGSGTSQISK